MCVSPDIRIGPCNTKSQPLDYWLIICFLGGKSTSALTLKKKCSKIQKQSFPTLQKLSRSVQGARRTVYLDFAKFCKIWPNLAKFCQEKTHDNFFLGPLKKRIATSLLSTRFNPVGTRPNAARICCSTCIRKFTFTLRGTRKSNFVKTRLQRTSPGLSCALLMSLDTLLFGFAQYQPNLLLFCLARSHFRDE